MRTKIFVGFIILVFCLSATNPAKNYLGFTDASTKVQHQWETRFDSLLRTSDIDRFLKQLSSRPHHLGSPGDKANAEYILKNFRDWGFDARIDTFYTLFPTPKTRILEAISPSLKATLKEPALKEDGTSSQTSEQLPTYNCFSADGDVTGELVYVNQGVPADYEQLERLGVDVKGKIVIARYGGSWRGIKPRLAQEHGAVGCIIYSDPRGDGYFQGDTYPKGPYRSEHGVQRGSVLDMPLYPGDPLTPGVGHIKGAQQLDRKDVKNLLKIPVLPISYSDAKPFLAALEGQVAPENWRGSLPITYHVGPGPVKVHLKLEFNWDIVPVYDVIAMMKGKDYPNQWVMRGNHYDAWVNGASDPLSGQCAMLAEAQAVAQMMKEGMQLKRTMVYCAWDGEEEGLIGSTEWVETHAAELSGKVVTYINTDGNGRGFLDAEGSHSLETLVNEAAADVIDPQTNISILARLKAKEFVDASNPKDQKEVLSSPSIKIGALGSGSDYSSFLQHLGISCLNLGFGGENEGGEYHSIYDSYDMFVRFKDPGFKYEVALAKTAGRISLRLANADVLPFNFTNFYSTVNDYATDLMKKTDEMRTSTEVINQAIKDKYYVTASDPTKTYVSPKAKDMVPYLDFSALQNALLKLKSSVDQYNSLASTSTQQNNTVIDKLNTILYQSERKLLLNDGLPSRPWYKHSIYAPGYYTGYGVKTLPGVREAIENRDWKLAQQQIAEVSKTITAYAQQVDEAVNLLQK